MISTRYPDSSGVCKFSFEVTNWMDGKTTAGGDFEKSGYPSTAMCTIDPSTVATPALELDAEASAGIAALGGLEDTLRRALNTGSIREQQIGTFDPSFLDSRDYVYAVSPDGRLFWFAHEVVRKSENGAIVYAHNLIGPKLVGTGWQEFATVIPGGGRALFGMLPNGNLLWYRHDGYETGAGQWLGGIQVGNGWNEYDNIIPGGTGVLYGWKTTDGTLSWYKDQGYDQGSGWQGPIGVRDQWDIYTYAHIFCAGTGIVYTVDRDGNLKWFRHDGYLNGTENWVGGGQVGTGWDMYRTIFASGANVYGITPGGDLNWYKYEGYADGSSGWQGPATLGGGWNAYTFVFAQLPGDVTPFHVG